MPLDPLTPGAKLRLACELHELAVLQVRTNARRERPDASEVALDEAVRAWLQDRPGAEHGDGIGVPVTWPRSR